MPLNQNSKQHHLYAHHYLPLISTQQWLLTIIHSSLVHFVPQENEAHVIQMFKQKAMQYNNNITFTWQTTESVSNPTVHMIELRGI